MKTFIPKRTVSTPCPVGRSFNIAHATCKSCPVECGQRLGQRPPIREHESINVHVDGNRIITTARLNGLNTWNNKPRWFYTKERKKWEGILIGSVLVWGRGTDKRILQVKRMVKDKRHLIQDRDNLIGALKPLKDVLVRYKVLVDDCDRFLEFTIDQAVDYENPRIEICII